MVDTNDEFLFDDYFNNLNLNDELRKFYQIINEENLIEEINEESKLTDIRNENYRRYHDVNLVPFESLPNDFETIVNEIKKIYSCISPNTILTLDIEESYEIKKIIDSIYYHLEKLNDILKIELSELKKSNDDKQLKIKNMNFNNFDKKVLHEILDKYSDVVLCSDVADENIIDSYNRQIARKKDLTNLYRIINVELEELNGSTSILEKLNNEINTEINNINNKILYLEDLMVEKSRYKKEFNVFKSYFTNVIAYDDDDYIDVNRVYHIICEDLKLKSLIYYFEESFIREIEKIKQEEIFIYEKFGIKNIKKSLDYIAGNYMDFLESSDKEVLNKLYDTLNSNNFVLKDVYKSLKQVVNKIWNKTITNIEKYNINDDFCFICSNNQFVEEKHEAILITRQILNNVIDFSNYQIGFVCSFNNNILYVTENKDIMSVEHNDMSNLKTPKQIEQELINFNVYNKIALNGYITKIESVYFIDDGDIQKQRKAKELSEQYKIPLIILKR